MTPPVALTIAGSDSGGAAGVAADLATFAAHDVHGACAITAITAQDTTGVHAVHPVPADVLAAQLDAVFDDLPVAAVKTGMLGSPAAVRLVAERMRESTAALVVDPVLVATSGAVLGDDSVVRAYADLLAVATVVTPNLDEARALLGHDGSPEELGAELSERGCAVVLTGGPDDAPTVDGCVDWLAVPRHPPRPIRHPRVSTTNDHGTGCTFSAALAALLAHGLPLEDAVERAAAFTGRQLQTSRHWSLGRGRGPIAHTLNREGSMT